MGFHQVNQEDSLRAHCKGSQLTAHLNRCSPNSSLRMFDTHTCNPVTLGFFTLSTSCQTWCMCFSYLNIFSIVWFLIRVISGGSLTEIGCITFSKSVRLANLKIFIGLHTEAICSSVLNHENTKHLFSPTIESRKRQASTNVSISLSVEVSFFLSVSPSIILVFDWSLPFFCLFHGIAWYFRLRREICCTKGMTLEYFLVSQKTSNIILVSHFTDIKSGSAIFTRSRTVHWGFCQFGYIVTVIWSLSYCLNKFVIFGLQRVDLHFRLWAVSRPKFKLRKFWKETGAPDSHWAPAWKDNNDLKLLFSEIPFCYIETFCLLQFFKSNFTVTQQDKTGTTSLLPLKDNPMKIPSGIVRNSIDLTRATK